VIPNAGIPHNEAGCAVYPLEPTPFADQLEEFVTRVRRLGGGRLLRHDAGAPAAAGRSGCAACGRSSARCLRAAPLLRDPRVDLVQEPRPTMIGERVNAQGSRKMKRHLLEDDYDGVLEVAREQTEGGAHLLDVCVALTERQDEAEQMRRW
jgi:5-methyltetrahydrofolate--homocysteine methyltransferase